MSKIIVSYCLKSQASAEEYEKYFRQEKYSLVTSFPSVKSFKLNKVISAIEGEKSADYMGILEVTSLESYSKDRETEKFKKFLAKWINFAEPSSIRVFYAEELNTEIP